MKYRSYSFQVITITFIPNTIEKIRPIVDSFQSSGAGFPSSIHVVFFYIQ